MASEIEQAIRFVCEEKGLSYESVLETIETAMAAAYRKDYGNRQQNIHVNFDPSNGDIEAFDIKEVVEDISAEELEAMAERQAQRAAEREAEEAAPEEAKPRRRDDDDEDQIIGDEEDGPTFNPKTEIMVSDAQVLKMGSKVGDEIKIELPIPGEFGRMAAMTAKQVITQKLREAEREIIYNEYKEHEGEVLIGTVQRREGRVVLVDIGKTAGVILPQDQVRTERYDSGQKIKVYVREVSLGTRGPQICLSRASAELVRSLFDLEIPEIADEVVEIKAIAREAGARTKVAVFTEDETIDPIGACIGQRGVRIQTIITEIGGEKIDVIEWSEDVEQFIENALSPAKIASVELNEEDQEATIIVEKDQLSLAIGRGGQNVRLASELTGWRISVQEDGESSDEETEKPAESPEPVEGADEVEPETIEEAQEDIEIHEEVESIEEELEEVQEDEDTEGEEEPSVEEIAQDESEEADEEQEEVLEDNE